MTTNTIQLLCAGAAKGLVQALQPLLMQHAGAEVAGRFGAVGAMKEALLAGEPCDLMIVTDKLIVELAEAGHLDGATRRPLGRVATGIAVRRGEPRPDIATPEALRDALRAADGIYFPDPERATAGIHFANVMRELGIHDALAPRFRTFPNGATAMQPARFVGAEGNRWFIRGMFMGTAATSPAMGEFFEDILAGCIVNRGERPMAPGDLIPLSPPQGIETEEVDEDAEEAQYEDMEPFERGPEITETR